MSIKWTSHPIFKCSMKGGKLKERNQLYRHIIVESEYRSLINDVRTQAPLEDGSEKGNRQSTSQKGESLYDAKSRVSLVCLKANCSTCKSSYQWHTLSRN